MIDRLPDAIYDGSFKFELTYAAVDNGKAFVEYQCSNYPQIPACTFVANHIEVTEALAKRVVTNYVNEFSRKFFQIVMAPVKSFRSVEVRYERL